MINQEENGSHKRSWLIGAVIGLAIVLTAGASWWLMTDIEPEPEPDPEPEPELTEEERREKRAGQLRDLREGDPEIEEEDRVRRIEQLKDFDQ